MPCAPEHLKKLDTMFDAFFAPKKDAAVTVSPPNKDCSPFSDKAKKDTQMEPGNLGKKNAS
jgi:hypothetical protein